MSETAAFDAAVDTVEAPDVATVPFCGEDIPVKALPAIRLLKFSKMASRGIGTADVEGQAAMYDLITSVVVPEHLERFEELASDNDMDGTQLLEFVKEVIASNAGRPTLPPSSSQDGASDGSPKSKSESRVIDLGDGRIVEMQPGETAAAATARALKMEIDETPEEIESGMVAVELFE